MKRFTAILLVMLLGTYPCFYVAADAVTPFYQSCDFNADTIDEALPSLFSILGGGNADLTSTDRSNSLRFSVGNKNLSCLHVNLSSYLSEHSGSFQLGFSTKDIGTEGWGHRFFLLRGYTEAGVRKDIEVASFSKVTHRVYIGANDKGLYLQNIWYDVVMDFALTDTSKTVTIMVSAPYAPDFSATAQVDVSELATISELSLYSGVTSDPTSSVTLYDDVYIAEKQRFAVTDSTPQNGATNVGTAVNPIISFNLPLNAATITDKQVSLSCNGTSVENVSVCLEKNRQSIRLHLERGRSLAADAQYVILLSGVRDIFGDVLPDTEIVFTTETNVSSDGILFYREHSEEPLHILASGTITARASVTEETEAVRLLLALYRKSDGQMLLTDTCQSLSNGTISASLTVPTPCEEYCLYAYLWNVAEGQRPIVRAARLY